MPYVTLDEIKEKYKKRVERFNQWSKIDRNNINKEMAQNPYHLHFAGNKKSEADFLLRRAEYKLKRAESRAFKKIKKKSKITDTSAKLQIPLDKEVIEAQNECLEMLYLSNICTIATRSLVHKGEQITNIAYNYRKELDYNLVKKSKK